MGNQVVEGGLGMGTF